MVASSLLTVASLGQLFGYWVAIPEHIRDKTWPLHARFHMIQAFFWDHWTLLVGQVWQEALIQPN